MSTSTNATGFLQSQNPATGEVLGKVAITSEDDVRLSVSSANKAFSSWSRLSLDDRLQLIERFRLRVYEKRHALAELLTKETGKPLLESWVTELFGAMETARWLKSNTKKLLAPDSVSLNRLFFPFKKVYNQFEPLGTIAVISPWNYPFAIPVATMLTALAAGNTVVLKPSPKTPLVSKAIETLFAEAGFPPDTVKVIYGDRDQAKALVLSDVSRVVFTGSVGGGKAIAEMAAAKLHPTTLELGGKHPAIICADANLAKIAPAIAWCAFTNAGQACASIERLYVPRSIAKELEALVTEHTKRLRLGNGLQPDTDVGPMIDADQPIRVKRLVDAAIADGARLLCGGNARPDLGGHFFEPTVLTDVHQSMGVIQQEVFGPVLPIVPVDSEEEAIELANDCALALGASVWTADRKRGQAIASRIKAGMVWVNDGIYTHCCPDAPWGGRDNSGFGRSHGPHALLDFVHMKNISVDSQGARDWYFPYSASRLNFIRNGTELCHSPGVLPKVVAASKLLLAKLGLG